MDFATTLHNNRTAIMFININDAEQHSSRLPVWVLENKWIRVPPEGDYTGVRSAYYKCYETTNRIKFQVWAAEEVVAMKTLLGVKLTERYWKTKGVCPTIHIAILETILYDIDTLALLGLPTLETPPITPHP